MVNLKKPIREMIPDTQAMVPADESDCMETVAKRMEANESRGHLSQIPLRDNTGKIRYVVTGNGLARWAQSGRPNAKASEFSEDAHRFSHDKLLEDITDTVANYGYVLVTEEDDRVVGILSYTEVIKELAQ